MTMKSEYRAGVTMGALIAASLTLSGCLGPTYGTDKTATAQLFDDLGNIASLGSSNKAEEITYNPRPAIVKPVDTASLPTPQQNVVENNPAWVESPEETRARLVAEADAGGYTYRSPLARTTSRPTSPPTTGREGDNTPSIGTAATREQQSRAFREALKIKQGAYSDRRRYLSDPPLTYRQPAETAPIGDLGEPEKTKERRRLAEAKKEGTGGFKPSWWPW